MKYADMETDKLKNEYDILYSYLVDTSRFTSTELQELQEINIELKNRGYAMEDFKKVEDLIFNQ